MSNDKKGQRPARFYDRAAMNNMDRIEVARAWLQVDVEPPWRNDQSKTRRRVFSSTPAKVGGRSIGPVTLSLLPQLRCLQIEFYPSGGTIEDDPVGVRMIHEALCVWEPAAEAEAAKGDSPPQNAAKGDSPPQ